MSQHFGQIWKGAILMQTFINTDIDFFVLPELCSERDYVITHSVCSMYRMYVRSIM